MLRPAAAIALVVSGWRLAAPAHAEGSHFTVALAGGALVPQGEMAQDTNAGLDVWGRFGWTAANGLGLVMNLEYAPLRRAAAGSPETDAIDSQIFGAHAAPRLTLGHHAVRFWLAPGAGVVVDRTATATAVKVDTAFTLAGQGGFDFFFFENGGLTLAGGYTRALSSATSYEYVSVNAGLMFLL
jgi:hypothetical protein